MAKGAARATFENTNIDEKAVLRDLLALYLAS